MNVDRNEKLGGAKTAMAMTTKFNTKGYKTKKYQKQIKMADRETADHTSIHNSLVPVEEKRKLALQYSVKQHLSIVGQMSGDPAK